MTSIRQFTELLESLFDAQQLRQFVHMGPDGERLAPHLPGASVSLAHLAFEVANLYRRHGLLTHPELWQALIEARPHRTAEIRRVGAVLGGLSG